MRLIKDGDAAIDRLDGTHKIGHLDNITYNDLLHALGEPTYDWGEYMDKSCFEWVVEHNDEIYCIYDWKVYDRDHCMSYLRTWNIGGNGILPRDFKSVLKGMIDAAIDGNSTHL